MKTRSEEKRSPRGAPPARNSHPQWWSRTVMTTMMRPRSPRHCESRRRRRLPPPKLLHHPNRGARTGVSFSTPHLNARFVYVHCINVCVAACSMRERKAAEQAKARMVTASLRGEDYLPAEILSQLPPAPAATSMPMLEAEKAASSSSTSRAERRAAEQAKRKAASQPAPDGLPRVVRKKYASHTPPSRALPRTFSVFSCGHARVSD